MDLIQALETRRSVRKYQNRGIDREVIERLITLATQAPSAMNAQPWAFVVITDRSKLVEYSTRSKALLLSTMDQHPLMAKYRALLSRKSFDIFYHAPVLVAIYAKPEGPAPEDDTCLAAQNFMLAAHNEGLGTCWIGFSKDFLNSSEFKMELGIPGEYVAAAPMILGYPAAEPPAVVRKDPEIYWK
jgi:nitroreductase